MHTHTHVLLGLMTVTVARGVESATPLFSKVLHIHEKKNSYILNSKTKNWQRPCLIFVVCFCFVFFSVSRTWDGFWLFKRHASVALPHGLPLLFQTHSQSHISRVPSLGLQQNWQPGLYLCLSCSKMGWKNATCIELKWFDIKNALRWAFVIKMNVVLESAILHFEWGLISGAQSSDVNFTEVWSISQCSRMFFCFFEIKI